MRKLRIIISNLLAVALLLSFIPTFTTDVHAASPTKLELHAFYPSQITFSEQAKKYIDSLDSISFAWGRLYGDLTEGVNTTLGKNGNTMFYYPQDYIDVLKYAKSKNKSIQLSIFSDSVNAAKIFPYKEQRDKAVKAISDLLTSDISNGDKVYFDGVVIDIEGLQNTDPKGKTLLVNGQTIGSWYSQFLKELKTQLDTVNKKLYVAVNPLLNYTGYDYGAISATADKMIVMAHDYEPVTKLSKSQILQYTGFDSVNPIDSLAPIKKLQLVMEDIKKNISRSDLNKVMLQISFDAAQWRFQIAKGSTWDKTGKQQMSLEAKNTPTYQMIYDRIQNKDKRGSGLSYGYNNELQCPYIQYLNVSDNTQNILIYENSSSVKAKIDLAKTYGLGGISLWSIGNVPDFTDTTSKLFGLDVWDTIIKSLPISLGTGTVAQAKITFKDKVVETAVRKQLQKPTGYIYKPDLLKVYRLAVPAGYKYLDDLKQLTNLEYLDLSGTKLSNISALSSLTNLRVLYLQRNNLTNITALKGLAKLEILSVNGNKISNISTVANMKNLKELYIKENLITDFSPVTNLKNLNTLYLKFNKSTNYTKLKTVKKGLIECDF